MGDKSPKSKKRGQDQKQADKKSAAGKAKAKQESQGQPPGGKVPKKK